MNKFINILLLLLLVPIISFSIIVGFDIPLEFLKISGANVPYKVQIFTIAATLIFVIGSRRSIRRWSGLSMVGKLDRFKWNAPMAKNRYKQSSLYLVLESVIHFFLAYALFRVTNYTWPVSLVLIILGLDHLFFALISTKKQLFRVGITSKAILVADRDLKAVYFTGLQKISKQQQSLFFDYKDNLQISFPVDCISESEKENFKETLTSLLDRDRVFIMESFKNF